VSAPLVIFLSRLKWAKKSRFVLDQPNLLMKDRSSNEQVVESDSKMDLLPNSIPNSSSYIYIYIYITMVKKNLEMILFKNSLFFFLKKKEKKQS